MKMPAAVQRRLHWFNFPVVTLIALLQRTPVLRVAAVAEEMVMASPIGAVLKSVAALASLGAMNSLAGATQLVVNPTNVNGVVGTPITAVSFTATGAPAPAGSFTFDGALPPGLSVEGIPNPTIVNISAGQITGTPTVAGTFAVNITAWESPGGSGGASNSITVTYNITGGTTATAPNFSSQPQSQTVTAGANVTFSVAVAGSPAPTLQWRKDGANIGGATNATLSLASVTTASAGSYTVVATNSAGTTTSNAAVLTVNSANSGPPLITSQPASQTVATGSTVVFGIEATGTANTFQWKKAGVNVPGATSALLMLRGVDATAAGSYTCTVTNAFGSVTSGGGNLNVISTGDPGRLSALSIRGQVGTGGDVLIAGIISSGLTAIIQAVGPTLGVLAPDLANSVLVNPKLELYQLTGTGFAKVTDNDDWAGPGSGAAAINAAEVAAGATQLSNTASKDSALLSTLQPGVYTANVSGVGETTGTVLLQAYTVPSPGSGVLSALSIRGRVAPGDTMIAGLIISGSTSQTLILQAVGPTLGVLAPDLANAVVQNPKLDLYQLTGSGFVKIRENDDWGGDAQIIVAENAAGATPLSNPASKDCALLVTLPPGIYTANVSGVNNTGGVVLLQAYAVP